MILTVTPNPALDITYRVTAIHVGESHRVSDVHIRAGGKGLNVSSVLTSMARPTSATGILGGTRGQQLRQDLDERGISHDFLDNGMETRSTVNVVDSSSGSSTIFNEPGPALGRNDWAQFRLHVQEMLSSRPVKGVVLTGSLPPKCPEDAYAQLIHICRDAGVWVIVDADGRALARAASASPTLIKPNRAELAAATATKDVRKGMAHLLARGAQTVIVSAGPEGLMGAAHDGQAWHARLSSTLIGNPTGAGDAAAAALAVALADGLTMPEALRLAVLWSAAAVLEPLAGAVNPENIAHLADQVLIEEMT